MAEDKKAPEKVSTTVRVVATCIVDNAIRYKGTVITLPRVVNFAKEKCFVPLETELKPVIDLTKVQPTPETISERRRKKDVNISDLLRNKHDPNEPSTN